MTAPDAAAGGKPRRPDRRRERTRRAILDAALVLFNEGGIQKTTIDEIATRADVSAGTVYFHFRSKEGLYLSVVDEALALNIEAMESVDQMLAPLDRVVAAGRAYMRFALEHPHYFRMIALRVSAPPIDDPSMVEIEARIAGQVETLVTAVERDLSEAVAEGTVRPVPTADAMRFLWGAWNGVTALGFRPDRLRLSPDDVTRALDVGQELMIAGLCTPVREQQSSQPRGRTSQPQAMAPGE